VGSPPSPRYERGILLGTAAMRQRLTNQAMRMQLRAAQKIHDRTDSEIADLTPAQSVAFFHAAATVEMAARKIPDSELDQAERDDAPTLRISEQIRSLLIPSSNFRLL
jgi:hypothetical protein